MVDLTPDFRRLSDPAWISPTLLWSINATVALTLAGFSARAWTVERRDLASLMCCVIALTTAACVPGELAMMHATTPAEYGEWQRWLHIPAFCAAVGQLLFVRAYLGTGRPWLLWTIISARVLVLIGNFSVHPNFNFREIVSLRRVSFLGEQVSVVGHVVVRPWQWFATASISLIFVFVVDAGGCSARGGSRALDSAGVGAACPAQRTAMTTRRARELIADLGHALRDGKYVRRAEEALIAYVGELESGRPPIAHYDAIAEPSPVDPYDVEQPCYRCGSREVSSCPVKELPAHAWLPGPEDGRTPNIAKRRPAKTVMCCRSCSFMWLTRMAGDTAGER